MSEYSEYVSPPKTPTPEQEEADGLPNRQRPEPITVDLLVPEDGLFHFPWLVGTGCLDNGVRRRRFLKHILQFNESEMWQQIRPYVPSRHFFDETTNVSFHRLLSVFSGMIKIANWKLDHYIREAKQLRAELTRDQYVYSIFPDPVTGVMPQMRNPDDELGASPAPQMQRPATTGTNRRQGKGGRQAPQREVTPLPNPDENPLSGEVPTVDNTTTSATRRTRRSTTPQIPIPSDAEIIRMLTAKVVEIHGDEEGEANLGYNGNRTLDTTGHTILDPNLDALSPPPVTSHDLQNVEAPQDLDVGQGDVFQTMFSGDHLEPPSARTPRRKDTTVAADSSERNLARIASTRSPNVYIQADTAPVPVGQGEPDSFPTLEPAQVEPRRRRQGRRLTFDTEKEVPTKKMREAQAAMAVDILLVQVTDKFPAHIRTPRHLLKDWVPGLPSIENSGRKLGMNLSGLVRGFCQNFPLRDSLENTREEEQLRGQQSADDAVSGVLADVEIGEPSRAEVASRADLEATASRSAGLLGDLGALDQSAQLNGSDVGGGVEFSMLASPRLSIQGGAAGVEPAPEPMDIDVTANEGVVGGQLPAGRTITFTDLVPLGTERIVAARIFLGLLKHQAHKNVEMTQTEMYGEIKIRILNSEINPSQYEDSFLVEERDSSVN